MSMQKCALPECNNPTYRIGGSRWSKYCCREHAYIGIGRSSRARLQIIDPRRVREMAAQGMSAQDIAKEFNVKSNSVWQVAHQYRITLLYSEKYNATVSDFWVKRDADLIAEYEAGTPLRAIARKLGVSVGAVAGRLTRLDRIGERIAPAPREAAPWLPPIDACMWPVGDGWCGKDVENKQPYCALHSSAGRRPPKPLNIHMLTRPSRLV